MRKEIRLCGSGGQGIILAGIILAESVGIYGGKYVTQVQDYGPAARGDSSKTDIVISDAQIDYPKCLNLDILVALSQAAFDDNAASLKEDGLLIIDSTNVRSDKRARGRQFPMTEIARDRLQSPMSVNMVALGVVAALTGLVQFENLKTSMLGRVPPHTKDQNLSALKAGYELARQPRKSARPKNR